MGSYAAEKSREANEAKDRLEQLQAVVRQYVSELDNKVRDYTLIHQLRERMAELVGK